MTDAAYHREWRAKNQERYKEINRRSREKNAEAVALSQAKYRASHIEEIRAKRRAEYAANREKYRLRHLLKEYGLSIEQYNEILHRQGGVCAICKKTPEKFHVDHDHQTGQVRGLLCSPCNVVLGLMKDLPERLRAAAAYLDSAASQQFGLTKSYSSSTGIQPSNLPSLTDLTRAWLPAATTTSQTE